MTRTARKAPKKATSDFEFLIPTTWTEFVRMVANNPGDSCAIVASIFVMLYMIPATSSFAQPIVSVSHNVTDPAQLKARGWIHQPLVSST
jgi:hypothetical protein